MSCNIINLSSKEIINKITKEASNSQDINSNIKTSRINIKQLNTNNVLKSSVPRAVLNLNRINYKSGTNSLSNANLNKLNNNKYNVKRKAENINDITNVNSNINNINNSYVKSVNVNFNSDINNNNNNNSNNFSNYKLKNLSRSVKHYRDDNNNNNNFILNNLNNTNYLKVDLSKNNSKYISKNNIINNTSSIRSNSLKDSMKTNSLVSYGNRVTYDYYNKLIKINNNSNFNSCNLKTNNSNTGRLILNNPISKRKNISSSYSNINSSKLNSKYQNDKNYSKISVTDSLKKINKPPTYNVNNIPDSNNNYVISKENSLRNYIKNDYSLTNVNNNKSINKNHFHLKSQHAYNSLKIEDNNNNNSVYSSERSCKINNTLLNKSNIISKDKYTSLFNNNINYSNRQNSANNKFSLSAGRIVKKSNICSYNSNLVMSKANYTNILNSNNKSNFYNNSRNNNINNVNTNIKNNNYTSNSINQSTINSNNFAYTSKDNNKNSYTTNYNYLNSDTNKIKNTNINDIRLSNRFNNNNNNNKNVSIINKAIYYNQNSKYNLSKHNLNVDINSNNKDKQSNYYSVSRDKDSRLINNNVKNLIKGMNNILTITNNNNNNNNNNNSTYKKIDKPYVQTLKSKVLNIPTSKNNLTILSKSTEKKTFNNINNNNNNNNIISICNKKNINNLNNDKANYFLTSITSNTNNRFKSVEGKISKANNAHNNMIKDLDKSNTTYISNNIKNSKENSIIKIELPSSNTDRIINSVCKHINNNQLEEIKQFKNTIYYLGEYDILNKDKITEKNKNNAKKENETISNHDVVVDDDDEEGSFKIVLGNQILFRYEILKDLGRGSFGQAVKCLDHKNNKDVCIKIIKNKKKFTNQAKIEIKILQFICNNDVNEESNVIKVINNFTFRNHVCIAFELLDMNLYELLKYQNFNGLEMNVIRKISIQLLYTLLFLQKHKIIHCDLKPENILLKTFGKTGIKVIDFGSSCFENERLYSYIQSRFYRAPEIILGLSYGIEIDMWSFGCIIIELYTGIPIFPGENEKDQLGYIMEYFGAPCDELINAAKKKSYFFDHLNENKSNLIANSNANNNNNNSRNNLNNNIPNNNSNSCYSIIKSVNSRGKVRYPCTKKLEKFLNGADVSFIDLVKRCLEWDPKKRIKPDEAILHEWVTEGMPEEILEYHRKNYQLRINKVKSRIGDTGGNYFFKKRE